MLFPGVVLPIDVGRTKSLNVAEVAVREEGLRIALVTQTMPEVEDPGLDQLFPQAVEAETLRVMQVAHNRATLVARGLRRMRLLSLEDDGRMLWGNFEVVDEEGLQDVEAQGLAMAVRDSAKQLIAISPDIPDEATALLDQVREPGMLADVAASHLDLPLAEKMELLNQIDVPERLREVLLRLHRALETHKVKEHIDSHVRAEMGKHQREAMLRQRMRAIQEELGRRTTRTTRPPSSRSGSPRRGCPPRWRRSRASSSPGCARSPASRPSTR